MNKIREERARKKSNKGLMQMAHSVFYTAIVMQGLKKKKGWFE